MITANFIDNAKVMSEGQVTIPKDIRQILGIETGDSVTFIVENGTVRIVNSAVYAMQDKGLENEEDIMALVDEIRKEKPVLIY